MIAYPEKQRKCQEELERVIGRSRMPTLEDQNSLPYIRATIRELLRWRAVTPLGEPCPTMDGYQVNVSVIAVPRYSMEVPFLILPRSCTVTPLSRTIGMMDTSFPKGPAVSPIYGIMRCSYSHV